MPDRARLKGTGCYSIGDDTLWGVNRRKKGAANTLAALRSIRAARPDGAPGAWRRQRPDATRAAGWFLTASGRRCS
ncbi:hypothetical protein SAMN04487982_110202 [Streptomyces sp. ok210]|jgi:hypothetical protein|nr:hypothetical protein SAMN04487982_110202 [Streptomyces sp. ok210]